MEDKTLADKVYNGLASGTLTCDCCHKRLVAFEDVRTYHDHLRGHGHIRGLICNLCNTTLVETLQRNEPLRQIITYLHTHNPEVIEIVLDAVEKITAAGPSDVTTLR